MPATRNPKETFSKRAADRAHVTQTTLQVFARASQRIVAPVPPSEKVTDSGETPTEHVRRGVPGLAMRAKVPLVCNDGPLIGAAKRCRVKLA